MAVLTLHHWDHDQQQGRQEMRRLTRDAVVIMTFDPGCTALVTVRRFELMNDFPRLSTAALPWLFPLILLALVAAIAFAPSWLSGLVGVVVFFVLGFGGVTLYYRRSQQHDLK